MSSIQVLTFIILLIGVALVTVALFVWSAAKRRPSYEPLEYVINDAVKHIVERLPERTSLGRSDVLRILEYEVFYLQGLAQKHRSNPVETVAGGHEASIEFIVNEIQQKHGVSYSQEDIAQVLSLEADYLMAIGAIGEPVGEDE